MEKQKKRGKYLIFNTLKVIKNFIEIFFAAAIMFCLCFFETSGPVCFPGASEEVTLLFFVGVTSS